VYSWDKERLPNAQDTVYVPDHVVELQQQTVVAKLTIDKGKLIISSSGKLTIE
jgi:hypothetical protein